MKSLWIVAFLLVSPAFSQELRLMPVEQRTIADDISSYAFIGAMGLINADGNITSWNLSNDSKAKESNILAIPLAEGYSHYINTSIAIFGCTFVRSLFEDLDKKNEIKGMGTKDIFTLAIIFTEVTTISSWDSYKDNIKGEILFSEFEFYLTSSVLNIKF